jgi:predicted secreted protein
MKAMGTLFKIGVNAVGNLTSINGLELSADTIETTTLDSADGYRTFEQGLKDAGEVSISGYFDPTDATGQIALHTAFESGTNSAFSIEFPATADWTFNGVVTAFTTGAELEDQVSFEATIKVSGKPTLTITP